MALREHARAPRLGGLGTATLLTGVFLLARALHDGGGNLARYAGVGLMSWLGAALVEPLIDVVLR